MDQGGSKKEKELAFNNSFTLGTASNWKVAEAKLSLVYTGLPNRMKRRRRAESCKGAEEREQVKTSDKPQVHFMRSFSQKGSVESRHGVDKGSSSLHTLEKQKGLKLFLLNVACYTQILREHVHQVSQRMKRKLVEDVSLPFNPIFLPRSWLLKRWSQNLGTFVSSSQSIVAN